MPLDESIHQIAKENVEFFATIFSHSGAEAPKDGKQEEHFQLNDINLGGIFRILISHQGIQVENGAK